MENGRAVIRLRGEDGKRVASIRLENTLFDELDRIAAEANCSRNSVIEKLLKYCLRSYEIDTGEDDFEK